MEEKDINVFILKTLLKNKIKIILTTLLLGAFALGFTLFMTKKYTAFGVVYPTNSNSITEVVNKPDFGFETHADRLIQLFESQKMKELIINRFDLISYYQVDTTIAGWQMTINEYLNKDVSLYRTKYMSVTVSATMKDSYLAANVVNTMIDYIDTLRRDLFLKNIVMMEKDTDAKLQQQQIIVNDLLQTIFEIKGAEGEIVLSKNTQAVLAEKKENGDHQLGDNIVAEVLKKNYSIEAEKLINNYYHELGVLNELKQDKVMITQKITEPLPGIYKINKAFGGGKKTSPSILKNTLIGLIFGFSMSIIFFIVSAKWRQISASIATD